jgi:hypothetical protein
MDEKAALPILLNEEPTVSVVGRAAPPAVVIVVNYASGGLTIPLSAANARVVAAELVKYATQIEATTQAN